MQSRIAAAAASTILIKPQTYTQHLLTHPFPLPPDRRRMKTEE